MGVIRHWSRLALQLLASSIAILLLYWMQYLHIWAVAVIGFAMFWLVGWNIQEKESPRFERNLGNIVGGVILTAGVALVVSQFSQARVVLQILTLDFAEVESVSITLPDRTEVKLTEQTDLQQLVIGLRASLPYFPDREDFDTKAAGRLTVSMIEADEALEIRFVRGNKSDGGAIWMQFEEGGDYFSRELAQWLIDFADLEPAGPQSGKKSRGAIRKLGGKTAVGQEREIE